MQSFLFLYPAMFDLLFTWQKKFESYKFLLLFLVRKLRHITLSSQIIRMSCKKNLYNHFTKYMFLITETIYFLKPFACFALVVWLNKLYEENEYFWCPCIRIQLNSWAYEVKLMKVYMLFGGMLFSWKYYLLKLHKGLFSKGHFASMAIHI